MAAPAQVLPRIRRPQPPQQEESLLKTVGRKTLSGLGMVGNFLDLATGASSIRDLVAGQNPVDQFMTPFTDENRVGGRQLAEKLGILSKNKPGLDWGDVGGFAAEVALDPSTYVSGGLIKTLGTGGKVLSKAAPRLSKLSRVARMTTKVSDLVHSGAIPREALESAVKAHKFADVDSFLLKHGDEPVGGLWSLNKPLGGPVATFGTGELSQKIGGALDAAGEAARYGNIPGTEFSPGRLGAALFSRPNRGALSKSGQEMAELAHSGETAAAVAARKELGPHLAEFDKFAQTLSGPTPKDTMHLRLDAHDALRAAIEDIEPLPANMAHMQPTVDALKKINAGLPGADEAEGVLSPVLDDIFADYSMRTRFRFPGDKSAADFPSLLLSGKHAAQKSRNEILRDLAGGSKLINRLSIEPTLSGVAHTMKPSQLTKEFWDKQEQLVNQAMQQMGFPNQMYEHSRDLARWLGNLDPRHVSDNIPVFPHNPIEETLRRVELSGRAQNMAKAIRETIAQKGNHFTADTALPGSRMAREVFENAGLDPDKSLDMLRDKLRDPIGPNAPLPQTKAVHKASMKEKHIPLPSEALRESQRQHTQYAKGATAYSGTAKAEAARVDAQMADMAKDFLLTNDAKELLDKVAKNGVPAFVSKKMERILRDNGIDDSFISSLPPDQLLDILHARQAGMDALEQNPKFQGLRDQLSHLLDEAGVAERTAGSAREVVSSIRNELNDVYIPKELAEDIGRVIKAFRNPDEVNVVLKAVDKFTALFKTGVTSLAPAFHVRNRLSGAVQNWMIDAFSLRSANDIDKLLRGRGPITGLQELGGKYKGLSDEAATKEFAQEAFAQDVAPRGQGVGLSELSGTTLDRDIAGDIPGLRKTGIWDTIKSAMPRKWREANPLNVSGVATDTDVFAPAVAGRKMGQHVEAQNRLEGYLELRRKGYSPENAAEKIRAAHVDYSSLTDAERHVMRRVIPFYSFTKGMAQFVATELMQHPGGKLRQVIRASNQPSDEPMPEHVAQTAAISLGKTSSGSQRFITGLGLAHEDPLSFGSARGGIPDFTDTLAEAGSRLNPLLKYPIEAVTGESLFQRGPMGGREILSQDPTIGRLISNVGETFGAEPRELPSGRAKPFISNEFEQLAANLPTSRLVSTARTAFDPRKREGTFVPGDALAANLLTGLRVTDVSPAASDAVVRDEADAIMREMGAQSYQVTRFTKDQIAKASKPEQAEMLRYNALKDELASRSKIRKKERESKKPKIRRRTS